MELCPLTQLQHRIRLGSPLPFAIRDASSRLLLAKNQVVSDAGELSALVERGACVDVDELRGEIAATPPGQLPALWLRLAETLAHVLARMPAPDAPAALADAANELADRKSVV